MEIRTNGEIYSETFKIHVVSEVKSGKLSVAEVNRKYNIADHDTVTIWCRKYGRSVDRDNFLKFTSILMLTDNLLIITLC